MILLGEGRYLAGVFETAPALFVPPNPCWDPSTGRVAHLHHHAPEALCGHPTTRAPNQSVARLNIEHLGLKGESHTHQMESLQTDKQITPITTIKRCRAAAGRARQRPRFVKTAGIAARSSSRTSTSTYNPRPTPGRPHSTRKSQQSDGGVKM